MSKRKRTWTESSAVIYLQNMKVEVSNRFIYAKGFNGLKACSAFDYLRNHCKYKAILL